MINTNTKFNENPFSRPPGVIYLHTDSKDYDIIAMDNVLWHRCGGSSFHLTSSNIHHVDVIDFWKFKSVQVVSSLNNIHTIFHANPFICSLLHAYGRTK
jgi:hypothetical protein